MLISEDVARAKWCPYVRIDNSNRRHNTLTDGFRTSEKMYHCIAGDCMGWRQFHLSHFKGSGEGLQAHGYCGYAGKPELDWTEDGPPARATICPGRISAAARARQNPEVDASAAGLDSRRSLDRLISVSGLGPDLQMSA